MAKIVSPTFREILYSGEADHTVFLTIDNKQIEVENIKSIKISSPLIDTTKEQFYLGTFISQKVEITFKNANEINLNGQVYLEIGTKVNGSYEMYPIGYFNIETSPQDYYRNSKIVALDNAVKFKPSVDISQFFKDGLITCEELLIALTKHFLGENMLGTYPNINKDIKISTYDDSISGKQYISYIAEIMGSNAKIGRDGKLYIQPLKQAPVVEIDALESASWELDGKYEVSKVSFFDALRSYDFGDETQNTLYIRQDNIFVVGTDEEASSYINNIYNAVKGTIIYNLKTKNYGDYTLDSWDYINYNLDGVIYQTLNNNEINYEMNITSLVETKIPSKVVEQTTNVVEGDETQKYNRLRTNINQIKNQIEILAGNNENVSTDLEENYYTKEQSNELIINAENGLKNTFSTSGGNNLLRNSQPWYFNGDKFDYWEGNLKRKTEENSSNGYAFLLQNGIVKQNILLSKGNYSVSFKYKKLIGVANAKIRYNNKEIILEQEGEIKTTGYVNTNNFIFEMECDTDNGYEIYEIMVNHGDGVYLPYMQNQNEIKTTNVSISENITVESNIEETKTALGAEGLVGRNKNTNKVVFKQTKDGSYSENVEGDKGTIGGVAMMRVNNQSWIIGV